MSLKFVLASVALTGVSAAHAGGFAAPVVEAEPVAVAPAPVAAAWQGGYAGAALGYAFGGNDHIGDSIDGGAAADLGKAEISGANVTLRAGYRWQRNNWVVGPELSYMAGNISDEVDTSLGPVESKVDNVLALKLKTGYLVRPDMLVYGTAGWQKGNFTYTVDGADTDYDADGYVVGLGVEKMLTERMSVTGEYEFSDFGKTELDLGGGAMTEATPKFHNVKVGLNFRF